MTCRPHGTSIYFAIFSQYHSRKVSFEVVGLCSLCDKYLDLDGGEQRLLGDIRETLTDSLSSPGHTRPYSSRGTATLTLRSHGTQCCLLATWLASKPKQRRAVFWTKSVCACFLQLLNCLVAIIPSATPTYKHYNRCRRRAACL